MKKAIKRSHATRWNNEPRALGAFSAAAPGGQGARRILMEPVQNAVWFAGEAAHETMWGTVGGAWESGERAADAVLRRLGGKERAAGSGDPLRTQARRNATTFDGRTAQRHAAITNWLRCLAFDLTALKLYARSTPPVRLPTSPTILAASASISSSVIVRSRGWMVTAIAIDFLPGSMPVPS